MWNGEETPDQLRPNVLNLDKNDTLINDLFLLKWFLKELSLVICTPTRNSGLAYCWAIVHFMLQLIHFCRQRQTLNNRNTYRNLKLKVCIFYLY